MEDPALERYLPPGVAERHDAPLHGRAPVDEHGRPRLGYYQGQLGSEVIAGRAGLLNAGGNERVSPSGVRSRGSVRLLDAYFGIGRNFSTSDEEGVSGAVIGGSVASGNVSVGDREHPNVAFDWGIGAFRAGMTRTRGVTEVGAEVSAVRATVGGGGRVGGDYNYGEAGLGVGIGNSGRLYCVPQEGDQPPIAGFTGGADVMGLNVTAGYRGQTLGRLVRRYGWLRSLMGCPDSVHPAQE